MATLGALVNRPLTAAPGWFSGIQRAASSHARVTPPARAACAMTCTAGTWAAWLCDAGRVRLEGNLPAAPLRV